MGEGYEICRTCKESFHFRVMEMYWVMEYATEEARASGGTQYEIVDVKNGDAYSGNVYNCLKCVMHREGLENEKEASAFIKRARSAKAIERARAFSYARKWVCDWWHFLGEVVGSEFDIAVPGGKLVHEDDYEGPGGDRRDFDAKWKDCDKEWADAKGDGTVEVGRGDEREAEGDSDPDDLVDGGIFRVSVYLAGVGR